MSILQNPLLFLIVIEVITVITIFFFKIPLPPLSSQDALDDSVSYFSLSLALLYIQTIFYRLENTKA